MEYGEAINNDVAESAFRIAVQLQAEGDEDPHDLAVRAVSSAYCTCVTDGEDAAEHRLSNIHAALTDDVKRRLAEHAERKENG